MTGDTSLPAREAHGLIDDHVFEENGIHETADANQASLLTASASERPTLAVATQPGLLAHEIRTL